MLVMQCAKCAGSVSFPEQFAGQNGTCPRCNTELILQAASVAAPISKTHARKRKEAEDEAKFSASLKKVGKYTGFALLALAACFAIYWGINWLGQSWDREMKSRVSALNSEIENLKAQGNFEEAAKKNNEILTLTQNHPIKDTILFNAVEQARREVSSLGEQAFLHSFRDARALEGSKQLKDALKKYDDAIAAGDKVGKPSTSLSAALKEAIASRNVIYPQIKAELDHDAQEAARIAAEKQQLDKDAKEKERLAKLAEEARVDEERKLTVLRAKYKNAPKSAKDALNALKRIQAKTEVGVNILEYRKQLGDSWGDVKIFVESAEGKEYADLSEHMKTATEAYRSASNAWQIKIDGDGSMSPVQRFWTQADEQIKVLDQALNQ